MRDRRKTVFLREVIATDSFGEQCESVCRVATIVCVAVDMERVGAVIHPKLGASMRVAGGSEAIISYNGKIGGPGTPTNLPPELKDNPWSFHHFDTMTLTVPDGPLTDEIVMFLAHADRNHPIPRCGSGPVRA